MGVILREWLLFASATALFFSSLFLGRFPPYSYLDFQLLFVLLALFVTIKGLEGNGILAKVALKVERGGWIPLKFVLATFFLSMIVTNDVALLLLIPLTLKVNVRRKGWIVISEALAANAGSALTPIGNPQNLFIYWYYDLNPVEFLQVIAPLSLFFLGGLFLFSLLFGKGQRSSGEKALQIKPKGYFYPFALVILVLAAMRFLPVYVGIIVLLYAVIWDRKSLKIDYPLLLLFLCLFGLTENVKALLSSRVVAHPRHVFVLAAVLSQFISNVPAALLLAKLTSQWQALLWGVSVGGFGNVFASLANLIAYRLFVTSPEAERIPPARFLLQFTAMGYLAFAMGIAFFEFRTLWV